MFGLIIYPPSLTGWTVTVFEYNCVIRIARHQFKEDCVITTTTSRHYTGINVLGTAGGSFLEIFSPAERERKDKNNIN